MRTITLIAPDDTTKVDLQIEIADNAKERQMGLMNRDSLPENAGMLFAFKVPQMLSFWMRNTKMPLEILFFDAEGRFINSHVMQPCTQDPCPTYDSREVAQYALEVNKNFRETHGVGVGWKLDLAQVNRLAQPE